MPETCELRNNRLLPLRDPMYSIGSSTGTKRKRNDSEVSESDIDLAWRMQVMDMRYSKDNKNTWRSVAATLPTTCPARIFLDLVSQSPLVQYCDLLKIYSGLETYLVENTTMHEMCDFKDGWIKNKTLNTVKDVITAKLKEIVALATSSLAPSPKPPSSAMLDKSVVKKMVELLTQFPDNASSAPPRAQTAKDRSKKKIRYRKKTGSSAVKRERTKSSTNGIQKSKKKKQKISIPQPVEEAVEIAGKAPIVEKKKEKVLKNIAKKKATVQEVPPVILPPVTTTHATFNFAEEDSSEDSSEEDSSEDDSSEDEEVKIEKEIYAHSIPSQIGKSQEI